MRRFLAPLMLLLVGIIYADLTIDGDGGILELSSTGNLVVRDNTTLTLKNLTLKNLSGSRLVMEGFNSRLVLDNTRVQLDGNYSLTQGAIVFQSDVDLIGSYTFTYASDMTSTVTSSATLKLDTCLTFSYDSKTARQKASHKTLLEMYDTTSKIFLNGATFHVTHSGMLITNGALIADHDNTIQAEGTTISDGLTFGDATNATLTVSFVIFPGARLNVSDPNFPNGFVTRLTP